MVSLLGWNSPLILTFDPNFQRDIQMMEPRGVSHTHALYKEISCLEETMTIYRFVI